MNAVTVVGAGLAGSECAWQLAERGVGVRLIEQKPRRKTPAQTSEHFAELVCSNSFRGAALHNAVGLLKEEMRRASSLVMQIGEQTRVPAGGAFAVDRERFGFAITKALREHPKIEIVAQEVTELPSERPLVLATGPLTGDALAADLAHLIGQEHLAYYDAIAPIVRADSINWTRAFKASRYDKGGDDAYVNCPLDEAEYKRFIAEVLAADKATPRDFEEERYFEGCLPVEVLAQRGELTLAHASMKPVGLVDPNTGKQPFAVVQLRQEDNPATAYNMVGFQTRMKWPEQKRVFRMIPGLEQAEFERLGSVHRNTFVNAPEILSEDFALKGIPGVYLAGQISGVEGYIESAACGLMIGTMLAKKMRDEEFILPPEESALGALMRYLQTPRKDFQPSNIMWSMFPPLEGKKIRKRRLRREKLAERALDALETWLEMPKRAPAGVKHGDPIALGSLRGSVH